MAPTNRPQDNVPLQKPCKRCKTVAQSGLKCSRCDTISHNSCVKFLKNVTILENEEFICCAGERLLAEGETDWFDAMELNQDEKVDAKVFNYIIKQKDTLIEELYNKIYILNNQIKLLNENYSLKSDLLSLKDKEHTKTKVVKTVIPKPQQKLVLSDADKDKGNSKTIGKSISAGLLETQTKVTMDKYIHMQSDMQQLHSAGMQPTSSQKEEWTEVVHVKNKNKRKPNPTNNKVVIGKNSTVSCSLKGVPKQIDLHVYRVAPNTDVETLSSFLKDRFPEVVCQSLVPRHPDLYSSFKVRIYEKNLDKAMDPLLWPVDACVRPFLYQRRVASRTTS